MGVIPERLKKMGKILKYCSSCEEGFAEKFTFCPDCGASLQAFEMNPLADAPETAEASPVVTAETTKLVSPVVADEMIEPPAFLREEISAEPFEEEIETSDLPEIEEPEVAAPAAAFYQTTPLYADEPRSFSAAPEYSKDEDGYHITVIEEKNVKQRNYLLLGSTAFVVIVALTSTVVSLFSKDLGVGAIGDERSLAYLIDEVPMTVEEEKQQKEEDKGGGGGGGGREEKEETSQGDLADQSPTPTRPPDARTPRMENPSLMLPPPQTQGTRDFEQKYNRWGNPDSLNLNTSNGTGSGGGQGSGYGTGQGSGYGTGAGSGTGSGSGGGYGDGDGDGRGSGGVGAPPPGPARVTTAFKILAKPKAQYTDAARTANVQGSVKLKVTLLASGAIGSITPVTRLPHGLTEQAIAAARQIRFEPKKVNGVPQSTIVTFDYSFTMY